MALNVVMTALRFLQNKSKIDNRALMLCHAIRGDFQAHNVIGAGSSKHKA